jgi:hypothetical protein
MATWTLSFYNAKVAAAVEAWPVGVRASFLRIADVMVEHGPDLGMPHTRAMGAGCSRCAPRAAKESVARSIAPPPVAAS